MSDAIQIAVQGAAGRMGQRIVALAHADSALKIAAALESPNCPLLGRDAGEVAGIGSIGVPLGTKLPSRVDVVIDFSAPDAAVAIADFCAQTATFPWSRPPPACRRRSVIRFLPRGRKPHSSSHQT